MKDIMFLVKLVALSSFSLLACFVVPVVVFELVLGGGNVAYQLFLITAAITSVLVTGIAMKQIAGKRQ